eukprot:CAMPEP_0178436264 /NCGR_PEP_ID=MMETSP0689_2-20121128/34351_1 /TAXON_ID=160604 /ORGANISM="Amphidinium massartii, Strain CS-259" /LENGTH=489 /DNA_ID=CAMNT_0020058357 /DNA_START=30 /DNA_END=1499 /DNA_ORIENTATION=+
MADAEELPPAEAAAEVAELEETAPAEEQETAAAAPAEVGDGAAPEPAASEAAPPPKAEEAAAAEESQSMEVTQEMSGPESSPKAAAGNSDEYPEASGEFAEVSAGETSADKSGEAEASLDKTAEVAPAREEAETTRELPPAEPAPAAVEPVAEEAPPAVPAEDQPPQVEEELTEPPPKKSPVVVSVEEEIPEEPDENLQQDKPPSRKNRSMESPGNKSTGSLGISHADMRAKTAIAACTVDGVLKRTTFMSAVSAYHGAPKYSIASRGPSSFARSSSTPAPGSYSSPELEKSKFKNGPRFSFGSSARFGLGPSPLKMQPGPGQYNPRDPTLNSDPKVGFGSSKRVRGDGDPEPNPGPGAYEVRSTVGDALMFTARGRQPTSYMKARSQPGPGAYTPKDHYINTSTPKCGFGTSTREELASRVSRLASLPGPGAYELHQFKTIGKDSLKFSATSRRRMHDISSYTSPGPGAYNAHVTQFGDHAWPGANVP